MTAPVPVAVARAISVAAKAGRPLPAKRGAELMAEQLGSAREALAYMAGMGETTTTPWWREVERRLRQEVR